MTATRHITTCVLPHAAGWHVGSWRRPWAIEKDIWNIDVWKNVAQTAERGKLDAVFVADNVCLWPMAPHLRHLTAHVGQLEPYALITAMAMVTERIGLFATAHTEYGEPYHTARQTASIDHISHGRMGWNVVTSAGPEQAQNFGQDNRDPVDVRYERAQEYVDVVRKLWDSWEDDAYIRDREAGIFYDPKKMHVTNHEGKYFKVKGPLNVMRPPQGYPVLAQAGSSGPGKHLSASIGDVIFTPHTGEAARAYRNEIRELARQKGRDPDSVKILAQITPVIGRTQQEAEDKWAELQSLAPMEILQATVEAMSGLNLSGLALDEPVPEDAWGIIRVKGYADAVMDYIRTAKPTVRQLIQEYKGPGTVVGTTEVIADYMENEVDSGACDGFNVLVQGMPEELEDFVEFVVPELQERGRFRKEYEGKTLREHLGLPRPANQFAGVESEVVTAEAWNAAS